ncbi:MULTISPECIES: AAA family ATPase [Haloferax]|uniref:Methanol dehydrogenase regulatory protein n=4 Tax=Haloferax TaxID=2251 RepID=M0HZ99_HALVO|nr:MULTISPECIES: AAA family ATPase [Haloferax]ELK50390.1 methanol dehydrogenase regulatory protein [Haloferax sp. BAB-2207]ELZ75078.1 methanol dehydrogenase regulatory protein [Haloferax lucentense DSM 14919]ELZ88459.1 methanol dehydrogenase regulatory protein [Haloferax alexandrinus JCM 10717]MBC9986648.1 AAA family ATPase [Haloferax sp. AS1]QIB78949.1 AAA domain-containing protein [Haloferax alexandrinus]
MTDAHADADFDPAPSVEAVSDLATRISENVERVIVGHHDAIEDIIVALFARGHLLLEDVPGVGKTMLARAIATSIEGEFERIQFTPDLLPSDVTGVNVFNQQTSEFEFREGPVFGNVVLGDEINRAPPKTQAALLEVMEELQVTVDGVTRRVPDPFTVIATQNDVEPDRTYDLPLAELDRFMKKIHLGYPNEAEETELLGRVSGHHPIESLEPVASAGDVRDARERILDVTVSEPVRSYVSRLAADTRARADLGVSPRGSIALVRAAQARAALDARDYVVPDDVQREVRSVWAHRIRTTDERAGRDVVQRALDTVPVE